ncbi:MAG TPA: hypothetical protein VFD03_04385 [Clostridia bacterium]|nr:hypothetical protein [Clostridia bacterium]
MLRGKYTLLEVREITGAKGVFRIAKLGDSATCTQFDLFIPTGVDVPAGKEGKLVDIEINLEQRGYKLSGTLRAVV